MGKLTKHLRGADLGKGSGIAVDRYVALWLEAVEIQGRRLQHRRSRHRELDVMQFVVALYQLRLAADFVHTMTASTVLGRTLGAYVSGFRNMEEARHAIVHFPDWRAGQGRGQAIDAEGKWIVVHGVGADFQGDNRRVRLVVRTGPQTALSITDVATAVENARILAQAAHQAIHDFIARHAGRA